MENNTNNFDELKNTAGSSDESDFLDPERIPETKQEENPGTNPGANPTENPGENPGENQTYNNPDGTKNLGLLLGEEVSKQIATGIDFILSGGMALLSTKIAKRPVYMENFRQSAGEIKNFSGAVHECLKTINVNLDNPWIVLGFLAVGTYGAKAANVTTEIMAEKMENSGETIAKKVRGKYKKREPKS